MSTPTPQPIADWLEKLGLGQYAQRFVENEITLSILSDLTDADLKELGVSALGHRRLLLRAIAELHDVEKRSPTHSATVTATGIAGQRDSAERRQVTVMFSDLVGSTALSARLDPEDLREVISAYQKCVAESVKRFSGFVAKYLGDGVLVYFGYPQAHEDDPERAVRAGLALIDAVANLPRDEPLQTRVGIATGLVVVGDLIGSGEAQERGIAGETPNLAARLQGIAEPNTVVIAESTRKLIGQLFELENLGPTALKGVSAAVRAYAALRPSALESRFEALRTATTPLIGRDEEVEVLLRRWEQAKHGDGCALLISGEPGIGKSRITETIVERLSGEPHTRLRYFCSPHHQDSALYPSIAQLERVAGFRREDTADQRLAKLEAVLVQGTNDLSEVIPLLADLLSIPTGDRYSPINLTPQKRKEKTLHAQLAQLEGLAARQPVLMVWEDVHWSDPTSFSYELVSALSLITQQQLDSALAQLVSAELIFRRGIPPEADYTFKHALVQDAAYSTLLKSRRQQIHARIVATLEEKFPDVVAAQPALLAQHCSEASLTEKGVEYWLKAGQHSVERSAMIEAMTQLDKGLELLKTMPDATAMRQQEIRLLATRAVALRVAKGYGSDELLATLLRARDLCQKHGDPRQMFQILFGLWTATVGRGDWLGGKRSAEECLVIARNEADSAMLIEAHRLLGSTAVYMADHHTAERNLRNALQLYEPEKHRANALLYGYDPGTTCNGYISWALWLEGKVTQALAASTASQRLAIESKHAPSLALAYGWATFLHLCTHDLQALGEVTSKLLAHCEEYGFPHWLALGKIGRGWFWARTGRLDDGLELLQIGIEEFRSLWGGFLVSAWLICLADVFRIKGRFAESRAALDDSMTMIERFNERIWKAENHLICGEIARDVGQFSDAASAFDLAIKTAREQSARSLELRAATSLARLWRDQGKRDEARDLLAPVYGWFTEGFDTRDLKEAKALLDEVAV